MPSCRKNSCLINKGKIICVNKITNKIVCKTLEWTNNGIDFNATTGTPMACFSLGQDFANFNIKIVLEAFQGVPSTNLKDNLITDNLGNFCLEIPLNTTQIIGSLTLKFPPETILKCTNSCAVNAIKCGSIICETKHGVTLEQTFSPYTFDLVWRSWGGDGNNLANPNWGMRSTALIRIAPNGYADGISTLAVRGATNPNPRTVSNSICKSTGSKLNTLNITDICWAWGQFIDHEIDLTPPGGTESIDIITPTVMDDPNEDFPGRTISMTRSVFIAGSSPRQQPNNISSFIDASNVYGYNANRAYALRLLDGSGKMKTSIADNGEIILPYNLDGLHNEMTNSSSLSLAGDVRANENVLLASMHTLFVREHNRLCDEVIIEFPEWIGLDELVYQHARRIVCGIMHNITYQEFLPALLGDDAFDTYTNYDKTINASVATEFSSAMYRVGHTMLSSTLKVGTSGTLALMSAFFNPSYIQTNGIDQLLQGASNQIMQQIDGEVVDDIRNFLFGPPSSTNLLDLAAMNIQRGRDHGLPGYNSLRVAYGLSANSTFAQITSDVTIQTKLATLYDGPDSIDPWIGALVEDHLPGKAVGKLLYTSLHDQFLRLRDGDRFWFELDPGLNEDTKNSIRNTTLSDVIIRNTTLTSSEIQNDVFHL